MQKGVITLDHPDFKWLTYVHQFQILRFYNRPSSSSVDDVCSQHPSHKKAKYSSYCSNNSPEILALEENIDNIKCAENSKILNTTKVKKTW